MLNFGLSSENTATTISDNSSNSNQSIVQVKIITDGSWSATVDNGTAQSSYEGEGEKTIDIGNPKDYIISAFVEPLSEDSSELTIQILKEGKVIEESSEAGDYGVVSVSTKI